MTQWIICGPLLNGLHLTRKALPTFLAQDIGNVGVMFYDNASEDGTKQWLQSLPDDVVSYVTSPQRCSVAAAWNRCLRTIFRVGKAPYALVVNNDVELPPHFCRMLVEDGGQFVTGVGVSDRSCLQQAPNPESKSPHPCFSAFLIRRDCWERVGPFDEEFLGAYFEDNAYNVECHRKGIQAYSLDVPFYHVGSATLKNSDEAEQERIRKAYDHNKEVFRKKYGCVPGEPEYDALFTSPVSDARRSPAGS